MPGRQNEDARRAKMSGNPIKRVRVTTQIRGKLKQSFFEDSIKQDLLEAKLAECIFKIHYAIVSEFPALGELEYADLRKMDGDRIRECVVKVLNHK